MKSPLLTIAIPTYNRAGFLDRCLNNIIGQLKETSEEIEILVSDNASTDSTCHIVKEYNKEVDIYYILNKENKGPDFNIAQSFDRASGKYVWIFGDDDFLLPGSLKLIIDLLKQDNYGELLLAPMSYYSQDKLMLPIVTALDYEVYENSLDFMQITTYWVTFITGNIINKQVLSDRLNVYEFMDTNLVQINWTLWAIFSGLKTVYIRTVTIACEQDNSGGYKYLKVFSINYNKILNSLLKKGMNKQIVPITNRSLIKNHLPTIIYKILYTNSGYKKENGFITLLSAFWNYIDFWKIIFPIYLKFLIKKILFIRQKAVNQIS